MKKIRKNLFFIILFSIQICYLFGSLMEQIFGFAPEQQAEGSAGQTVANILLRLSSLNRYKGMIEGLIFVFVVVSVGLVFEKNSNLWRNIHVEKFYKWVYVWNYAVIFISYDHFKSMYNNYGIDSVDLSFINKLIIFGLTLLGVYFIEHDLLPNMHLLEKYINGKYKVGLLLVLLYVSFACCGEALFLAQPDKAWNVTLQTVSIYLLMSFWVLPFVLEILFFLEAHKMIRLDHNIEKISRNDKIVIIGMMLIIYAIYFAVAYPGVLTADSIDGWNQIINCLPLTRKHPPMVKIIWLLVYKLTGSVAMVTVLQIMMWIWVVGTFLFYFIRKGMTVKTAKVIALLTSALTPYNLYVLTQLANFWYMITILWIVYFMLQFIDDISYSKKKGSIIGLGIALAGIFLTRNEGKVVYIVVIIVLSIYALYKKCVGHLCSVIISMGVVLAISGPIFNSIGVLDVQSKSDDSVNMLVNDVTLATVYFNGNLSSESKETLQKYASLEEIAAMYYDYGYSCEADGKIAPMLENDDEVWSVAIDSIIHNIPIAFRERLNKSENVWNIIEPFGAKQSLRSIGVASNDLGLHENRNILYAIFMQLLYYPTFMFCVFDILFYRAGIYVCLLVVFSLYWLANRRRKMLLIILPVIAHVIVLLLSLVWPIARHTWIIILVTWIMMGYEFYVRDSCHK